MEAYDSTADTLKHIARVQELMTDSAIEIMRRGVKHDRSKLVSPEKDAFDSLGATIRDLTYGTPEYKAALENIRPAIQHHYLHNTHHPEHYANGVDDMDLFDVLEMLMDWKAAGERHADGCIYKSIKINAERFNMSPQLVTIFIKTANRMGWEPRKEEHGS